MFRNNHISQERIHYAAICSCFVLSLISCGDNEIVDGGSSEEETVNLTNYFPLSIGNTWIYEHNTGAEFAITQRIIVDTIRAEQGQLLFRAQYGLFNFPQDEYLNEYFIWDKDGLWQYSCPEETCTDGMGTQYSQLTFLLLKSFAYEGEEWEGGPEKLINKYFYRLRVMDTLAFSTSWGVYGLDTTFYEVAEITRTAVSGEDTTIVRSYYAPDIGLIGTIAILDNFGQHSDLLHFEVRP